MSYTNPEPSQHLADYKLKHTFKPIQKLFVIVNSPNLICSSFCCLDHTLLHLESENSHVDIERAAELFCTESIGQKRRKLDSGDGLDLQKSNFLNKDLVGDVETFTLVPTGDDQYWYIVGLRGLNNSGSTCFMNSVQQALLYALPFRDYFLKDGHSLEDCKEKTADEVCMLCEVNDLFTAAPYSPAQFLYSWWKHYSPNLASYEQQDAHEFFIWILDDAIHEKEGNTKTSRGNQEGGQCECIAHRVFYGLLRSDVTCMTCGSTSVTTYDPFADISLNLNTDASTSTLKGCLDLFTRPEKLWSEQKLYCPSCKKRQNSMKQTSRSKKHLKLIHS